MGKHYNYKSVKLSARRKSRKRLSKNSKKSIVDNNQPSVECRRELFPIVGEEITEITGQVCQVVEMESDDNNYLIEVASPSSNTDLECNFKISGRRIVDLVYFFNQIKSFKHHGLFNCSNEYLEIKNEKREGFISTLTIKCRNCHTVAQINTESNEKLNINKAAVLGIVSTGGGYSQLNEFTAVCDIPCMSPNFYVKHQHFLSENFHTIAWKCMEKAAKEEAEIAREMNQVDDDGVPIITVVADGAWSKRSYNVNYNASSGVGCIIGNRTGKLLYVGRRNKYCCVCSRAEHKNETPKEHICFKNWEHSTTSMEADIIVEGFCKSVELHGIKYGFLVGDGDSTVTKKLQERRPYGTTLIHKIECSNHLMRNYCNKLRTLTEKRISSKKLIVPIKQRNLLKNNIKRLRNGITSAVNYHRQIQDEAEFSNQVRGLRKDILNSINHVFGDHSNCSKYFCKGVRENETNYIPEFKQTGLYDDLLCCINRVAHNADSLLRNMNNNVAEQYNSIIAKFIGGKRVNFSSKGSYQMRCQAAAISFNERENYYNTIYKSLTNESPGKHTKMFIQKRKNMTQNTRRYRQQNKNKNYKYQLKTKTKEMDYGLQAEHIPDMVPELYERAKEKFLQEKIIVTNDEINHIERKTIGQSNKKEWEEARENRLTSSIFGQICKLRTTTNCAKKVHTILYNKFKGNTHTQYGLDNEQIAKIKFQEALGCIVHDCGLFVDKNHNFLATSPDGLIGSDGIIEIKCPSVARDLTPTDAILDKKIKFATIENNSMKLKRNHDYYFQIQGQLNITNRNYCYFVIYTPLGILYEKILKDNIFWESMLPKLIHFYEDSLLPEIVDPRQTRNLKIRDSFMK